MWKPIIALIFLLLLATPCMSAVLNVPSQYSTLSEAITAASSGDTLMLEPGIYTGTGFSNLDGLGNAGALVSSDGAESTIIDLEGEWFLRNASIDIRGITFKNGSVVLDSGRYDYYNCTFEANQLAVRTLSYPAIIRGYDSRFIGNDTCVHVRNSLNVEIWNTLFLSNGICLIIENAEYAIFVSNVMAYNQTLMSWNGNGNNLGICNSIAYMNNSEGDAIWCGCNVIWNDSLALLPPQVHLSDTLIFAPPQFCDTTLKQSTDVDNLSPCLPENNFCGNPIGKVSLGCSCCNDDTRGNVDYIIGPAGPIDVSDLTYIVAYLFQGGPEPPCLDAANVDGIMGPGGPVDVSDLTYLVAYLFKGGPTPPTCP